MRILLCGGGTAGHVMPAIAISEIVEKHFKNSEIAFAGRSGGDENTAYLSTGKRLYTIDISGIKREISVDNIKSLLKVLKSSRNARNIIKDFKPDIIIGTGGYVCYPFLRQGQRLKIKTAIHESNVYPGLVTRMLGHKCDALMINLDGTRKYLTKTRKIFTVGNPTRTAFSALSKSEARSRLGIKNEEFFIVSFGGSLGAERINYEILKFIDRYVTKHRNIRCVHATGKAHFDKAQQFFPRLLENGCTSIILPYIKDMPTYLTAADLAITRSGAMTVSELSKSATPSILIPSPNVTANHQFFNAQYMQNLGAAILIEEKDLCYDTLVHAVSRLLSSKETLDQMSKSAYRAQPRSTEKNIINVIKEIQALNNRKCLH